MNRNNFHLEQIFDAKTRQKIANRWQMVLTKACVETFQEIIFPFIQSEVMQGKREELADGRTLFQFDMDDEKTQVLKQALFNVVSQGQMN